MTPYNNAGRQESHQEITYLERFKEKEKERESVNENRYIRIYSIDSMYEQLSECFPFLLVLCSGRELYFPSLNCLLMISAHFFYWTNSIFLLSYNSSLYIRSVTFYHTCFKHFPSLLFAFNQFYTMVSTNSINNSYYS